MSTKTTATDGETVEQIESLPWVEQVRVTQRDEATHVVLTRIGVIRRTHEVLELQNCGATVEAFAPGYHSTMKVYISV
jgi:hypothetical protein